MLNMVHKHNRAHEFEHQEGDHPTERSEENIVGQNSQDSLGVTSDGLPLQLVPLIT